MDLQRGKEKAERRLAKLDELANKGESSMCEAKGIYWHADFAELRRSTYTSIICSRTQVKVFESADFVARACPATAGAGKTGTHTEI